MAASIRFDLRLSVLIITFALSLLAFSGVYRVDAGATLQLLMERYVNPGGRDYRGSCCDPFCWSDCDHMFRFSLDRGNSDNNPRGSHYWMKTTGEYKNQDSNTFGSNMNGVRNPIVTRFRIWPSVGVKLKVFVKDDDGSWSSSDDVDGLVWLLRQTPARSASSSPWTSITVRGLRSSRKTSLTFRYKLYCDANYYSSDCSVYCVARDTDAAGHYTCDPVTGSKICRPGWENARTSCRTRSNDCIDHRCRNGATCVDRDRTYTCHCAPGYTGWYCETDIYECQPSPCLNGGSCTDLVAGYRCTCPSAFIGRTCGTPYCLANNPCRNGATCHGAGLCRCRPGFIGSDCSVDMCRMITCHNGGSCVNGSCVCPVGIAGSTCDVVKCDMVVCLNGGVCNNGVCSCPAGFTGDVCQTNIDECASNPCQNGSTCHDLVNGYICACMPEFTGRTCSTPYCTANNPCRNGATCHGAGRCRCPPGFVDDDCSIDRCDLLDCRNGASCVNGSCLCPPGVVGANCEVVQCSFMICLNGGSCSEGTCKCQPGFTGRLCETDIDDCADEPCQHNGTCDDHLNGFTCRCLPDFTGKLCSETISSPSNTSEPVYDQLEYSTDDDQIDAFDIWFYSSSIVIAVLLFIIIILSVCLCCKKRSKSDVIPRSYRSRPQPAPSVACSRVSNYDSVHYNESIAPNDYDEPYELVSGGAVTSARNPQAYTHLTYGSPVMGDP